MFRWYIYRSLENLPFCPHWSWERFWVVTLKGRYINFWMNEWMSCYDFVTTLPESKLQPFLIHHQQTCTCIAPVIVSHENCFIPEHTTGSYLWQTLQLVKPFSSAMFPLIFQSLCVHKISFVQHFTRTHLYLEWREWNIFGKEHLCALQVSLCAFVSMLVCVRRCAQLRGNIGHVDV